MWSAVFPGEPSGTSFSSLARVDPRLKSIHPLALRDIEGDGAEGAACPAAFPGGGICSVIAGPSLGAGSSSRHINRPAFMNKLYFRQFIHPIIINTFTGYGFQDFHFSVVSRRGTPRRTQRLYHASYPARFFTPSRSCKPCQASGFRYALAFSPGGCPRG